MSQVTSSNMNSSQAVNSSVLIDALTSNQQRVINSFVTKMPWALVKESFKFFEIDDVGSNQKSKTSDNLIIYLNEELKSNPKETKDLIEQLKKQLLDNLSFGTKAVFSYDLNAKALKGIESSLSTLLSKKDFPSHLLSESEINKAKINKLKLVSKDSNNNMVCFVFSSVKTLEKTTKLDPSLHKGLEAFSKLYGKEIIRKQYFDTILLDYNTNKMRVLIDVTDNEPSDFSIFYKQELLNVIKNTSNLNLTSKEKDVFSIVTDICEQQKQPYSMLTYSVHELCFVSIEGTNYKEKKSPSKPDIRKDVFHSAGEKGANGNLNFYKVGVNFNRSVIQPAYKYKLLLTIPGTFKRCVGGSSSEKIDLFLTKNCMSYDDFLLISKVMR